MFVSLGPFPDNCYVFKFVNADLSLIFWVFQVKRRSDAKAEGKVWYNEDEAKLQRERIPASLRLEPGGEIREQQLAVYEHFAKSVPGFMTDAEMHHQLKMQEQLKMQMFVNYQRQQLQQQSLQQPGQKSLVQDVKEEDFMLVSIEVFEIYKW